MSSRQTLAGQRFSLICASYSSLKYLMVLNTGLGAVVPRAQREASLIISEISSSSSISPSLPLPVQILFKILSICLNPSRQGTHFPQDSWERKSTKYLATSTIQVSSSITIIPPEPIIEPASVSASKSTGRSSRPSGIQPPEGPPV
ncbi:hypothetical protein ES705_29093 [subsurface metagenome]